MGSGEKEFQEPCQRRFGDESSKFEQESVKEDTVAARHPDRTPWSIRMQQDNAPAHVPTDDKKVNATGYRSKRKNVTLDAQTPNGPDFNVLDLCMFTGTQSLRYKAAPRNVEELVAAVINAFDKYPAQRLVDKFLTIQKCMECYVQIDGANNHKLPNMKK